jgi:transposase
MMGTKERTFAPLVAVSLEALVPQDHFYRHLDRTLDLSFVRDLVQETYAAGGRPSIDPVVFFRLQLVMFFEDIRSERLLMRLVADRLSVRWFLGYDLNEPLPDHSSLTRIRTRYGLDVFRRFFEAIVEQCLQAKLVWGQELYFDATQVNANADLDSLTPRFALQARAALRAHLAALFAEESHEEVDQEPPGSAQNTAQTPPAAEASAGTQPSAPTSLPVVLSAPLREALTQGNATRHDWIAAAGRPQREVIRGHYQRRADFLVSTTDPDATSMRLKGGGTHLGYHTHYVVDGGKRRIILNVLVTPSEVMENQPMLDLLWRTCFRWRLWPDQVTGDTTYGTAEIITALEPQHIRPYVPLPDFDQRTEFFGQQDFRYDQGRDVYVCPNGAELAILPSGCRDQFKQYRAKASVCNACPLKARCTTSRHGRKLSRHVAQEAFEWVRASHQTEAYQKAMRKRKVWVEPLFAEAKEWHGMRRFRLRRLWRVNCEALLIAAGQNLKRLLTKRGWGRRPLPSGAALSFAFFCGVLDIWGLQATRSILPIIQALLVRQLCSIN